MHWPDRGAEVSTTHPKESIALKTPPYVAMYPGLSRAARSCGYALAVHGSMARDMDLIAVPWTTDAKPPEVLVEALRDACGGWVHAPDTKRDPTPKPHGRLVWTIHMGGAIDGPVAAAYIDLSVMPLGAVEGMHRLWWCPRCDLGYFGTDVVRFNGEQEPLCVKCDGVLGTEASE